MRRLWYKLKCWAWHRYNTIKPRYMPHTWMDRDSLLEGCVFEVLSKFLEDECSPGCVDWYHEYATKVDFEGKEIFLRDAWQKIYDWYHNWYVPKSEDWVWEPYDGTNESFYLVSTREKELEHKVSSYIYFIVKYRKYMWT